MNHDRLDRVCEIGILALSVGILFMGPLAIGAVNAWGFVPIQIATAGVLFLWLVRIWAQSQSRLLWPPVCWGVMGFTVYAIIRACFVDVEYLARVETVKITAYALLFLAFTNNLYREQSLRIVVYSLLVLAVAEAGYGIYQFLTGSQHVYHFVRPDNYAGRGSGTFICPNSLAGFLEMALPFGIVFTVVSKARILTKVFTGYAALVIGAGLLLTVSRLGWLAAGISLLFLLVLLVRTPRQQIILLVLLLLLAGIGGLIFSNSLFIKTRFNSLNFTSAVMKSTDRVRFSRAALEMTKESPWLGVGPAHFDVRYRAYRENIYATQNRPIHTHNDYLNALADYGLVGLGLIFLTLLLLLWSTAYHWRHFAKCGNDASAKGRSVLCFYLGSIAGLSAILIHSVGDFNMHIPANAILAVLLMAILAACMRFATDKYWIKMGFGLRLSASIVLLGGIAWLSIQSWRLGNEEYWLLRAAKEETLSAERCQHLEKAWQIEPKNPSTAYAIAEWWRMRLWTGGEDQFDRAKVALEWYDRAIKLNSYDPNALLGYGATLHFVKKDAEAAPYYDRALKVDPNGYFTRAQVGWHYFQISNYSAAVEWLRKSLDITPHWSNEVANIYYPLAQENLAEQKKQEKP